MQQTSVNTKKKTKPNPTKTNLYVDIGLAIAFLIVFNPEATGLAVHEWLGVAFGLSLIAHILLHWQWVTQVSLRFFKKMPRQTLSF